MCEKSLGVRVSRDVGFLQGKIEASECGVCNRLVIQPITTTIL